MGKAFADLEDASLLMESSARYPVRRVTLGDGVKAAYAVVTFSLLQWPCHQTYKETVELIRSLPPASG